MVCPYAKSIRGVIVECAAAGRKVSALRYPCKGKYEKCPFYQKAKRAEQEARARQARAEAAEAPKPAVKAEAAPAGGSGGAAEAPASTPAPAVEAAQPAPGQAEAGLLCDEVYRVELQLAKKVGSFVVLDREELRKIADTLSESGHYVYVSLDYKGRRYEFLFDGKNLVSARVGDECRLSAFDDLPDGEVLIVEAALVRKPPA